MSNEYSPTEARRVPFSSGPSETHARPHQITGLMVLGFMIAFFAIIVGVNVFMAHAAISTFGGVETASSYHAGQMFERDVAMAKAQDAQHWRVDAKLTRAADGTTLIDITAHDGAGAPVSGVAASGAVRAADQSASRSHHYGWSNRPRPLCRQHRPCRRPMGSGHRVVASRRAAVPFEESRRSEIVALK
jgi:nitrogen fixation protein FixH